MSSPVYLTREYSGTAPPPGVKVPSPAEIFAICPSDYPDGYNGGIAYPPDSPVFWIKHGFNIVWAELSAQTMAHQELQNLGSPVRAPAIFYACELKVPERPWGKSHGNRGYIVMEYIPGRTAEAWLKDAKTPEEEESVYSSIALALSELIRIPVPQEQPPAAIDGGRIRHCFFDELAPVHYKNVQELEGHINEWLPMVRKRESHHVHGMELEPMVYCYSDLWLRNFIIDQDRRITVVDFSEVSILPCSFFTFALTNQADKLDRNITPLVSLPTANGEDNVRPLSIASAPIVMGTPAFANLGYRTLGRPPRITIERVMKPLLDARGDPVTVPHTEDDEEPETFLPKANIPPGLMEYMEKARKLETK